MKARKLAASLSYLIATRRHCLILFNQVSGAVWAKARGSLRFRFGDMLARAPCSPGNAPIQSASYPRSASNIAPDFKSDSRLVTSWLSWASPVVNSRRTGNPTGPPVLFRHLPRDRRADVPGQWTCRDFGEGFHDAVPDASRPPADKAVVAGRVRANRATVRRSAVSRKRAENNVGR